MQVLRVIPMTTLFLGTMTTIFLDKELLFAYHRFGYQCVWNSCRRHPAGGFGFLKSLFLSGINRAQATCHSDRSDPAFFLRTFLVRRVAERRNRGKMSACLSPCGTQHSCAPLARCQLRAGLTAVKEFVPDKVRNCWYNRAVSRPCKTFRINTCKSVAK